MSVVQVSVAVMSERECVQRFSSTLSMYDIKFGEVGSIGQKESRRLGGVACVRGNGEQRSGSGGELCAIEV